MIISKEHVEKMWGKLKIPRRIETVQTTGLMTSVRILSPRQLRALAVTLTSVKSTSYKVGEEKENHNFS